MPRKVLGGIDNQGQRLRGIANPTASDDGVPRSFIRYDLPFACGGKPAAAEVFGPFVSPVAFTLPAGLTGSLGTALTAATASAAWALKQIPAGSTTATTVATITFAAGARVATFTAASAITVAAGDILTLTAPATQDATLADIGFTFAGTR